MKKQTVKREVEKLAEAQARGEHVNEPAVTVEHLNEPTGQADEPAGKDNASGSTSTS